MKDLFDHLVGELLECLSYLQAEIFGRFQVDHELKLGRLHHWKFGWFGAVEQTASVDSHLAHHLEAVGRVAGKTAGPDELGPLVNRRQTVARRERDDLILTNLKELIVPHHQSVNAALHESGESGIDFARRGGAEHKEL